MGNRRWRVALAAGAGCFLFAACEPQITQRGEPNPDERTPRHSSCHQLAQYRGASALTGHVCERDGVAVPVAHRFLRRGDL